MHWLILATTRFPLLLLRTKRNLNLSDIETNTKWVKCQNKSNQIIYSNSTMLQLQGLYAINLTQSLIEKNLSNTLLVNRSEK